MEGVADRYPDVPIVRPLNPPGSIRADDNDSALSWRVTGEYDLTEEAMIYATVARGYKGMGANTEAAVLGSPLPLVEGEIPTTYEIGIKSRWWDNRFQLNADAFYTEVEDFQTNQRFETEETTVGAHFLANAESLETQGVELELSLAATENLYLSAAIAYVDATYKTYTGASWLFRAASQQLYRWLPGPVRRTPAQLAGLVLQPQRALPEAVGKPAPGRLRTGQLLLAGRSG